MKKLYYFPPEPELQLGVSAGMIHWQFPKIVLRLNNVVEV